jgi:hypothetical protein
VGVCRPREAWRLPGHAGWLPLLSRRRGRPGALGGAGPHRAFDVLHRPAMAAPVLTASVPKVMPAGCDSPQANCARAPAGFDTVLTAEQRYMVKFWETTCQMPAERLDLRFVSVVATVRLQVPVRPRTGQILSLRHKRSLKPAAPLPCDVTSWAEWGEGLLLRCCKGGPAVAPSSREDFLRHLRPTSRRACGGQH